MADDHGMPYGGSPMGGHTPPPPPGGMGPGGGHPPAGGMDPNQNLQVNVPDAVKGGCYSNAVSVNVNSNEVVVDFGYLLPNTSNPVIEVVSRVNMNHKTAESFLNVLKGAMEDFAAKQAQMNSAQGGHPAGGMPPAPGAPAPHAPTPPAPGAPGAHMPPPPPMPGAPLPSNS